MAEQPKRDTEVDVDLMVAEVESGARSAVGFAGKFILGLAFVWSLFQLYIASTIPFILTETLGINLVFNNQEARQIHLAFALALASLAYPLFKRSSRTSVPAYDWVLAIIGAASCLYLLYFKNDIADRAGLPTTADLVFSTLGMLSLGIAVFRSLGLPLVIVASVFVFYVFAGHLSMMPDAIQWKGASLRQGAVALLDADRGRVRRGARRVGLDHLPVRAVRLAAGEGRGRQLLHQAGLCAARPHARRAGQGRRGRIGHVRLYSGSSISNVVTTGTFTIPLMKRTGFKPEKAGAVEVASSTNGQLTPPVMGAAAFLITEFVGISYPELMMNAILPAAISYIALVYIVHLEAMKLGLEGLQEAAKPQSRWRRS
jgi:TRAP-type uncharacterized transport system fused permease subunit